MSRGRTGGDDFIAFAANFGDNVFDAFHGDANFVVANVFLFDHFTGHFLGRVLVEMERKLNGHVLILLLILFDLVAAQLQVHAAVFRDMLESRRGRSADFHADAAVLKEVVVRKK